MKTEVDTTSDDALLTCWKDIANYLGKGVRTVQRWEQWYGLPVRRPNGTRAKGAIARTGDLKAWLESNWLQRDGRNGRDVKPTTAPNDSVSDLIRTAQQMRSYHHELMLEARKVLETLASECDQLKSTRIASVATRQRLKNFH